MGGAINKLALYSLAYTQYKFCTCKKLLPYNKSSDDNDAAACYNAPANSKCARYIFII